MSAKNNEKLIRSMHEVVNSRQYDRIASLVDPHVTFTNVPFGETLEGPAGVRKDIETWLTAFPDGKTEVNNIYAGDNWAVLEFTGRGTHNGPLRSAQGTIAPTGKKVEIPFCEVYHFKSGKISSVNAYFDVATIMRQLGQMP